ncbi:MAG: hypothetical protein JXX29_10450 [Deltaproteobacteria bacterium]|nr:hypothetical protein [Deltaproteobacteria bacterium]MBN2672087.1 hypothetical protein [Deltaproteobacteria bacterium]
MTNKNMFNYKRIWLAVFLLMTCFVFSPSLSALNYTPGHETMIKHIIQLIKENEQQLSSGEIDEAAWAAFVEQFNNTRKELSDLTCDLPNPNIAGGREVCLLTEDIPNWLAARTAEMEDPDLRLAAVEYSKEYMGFVDDGEGSTYEVIGKCYFLYYNPVSGCNYDVQDNMMFFEDKLIKEVTYKFFERHNDTSQCFMQPATQDDLEDPYQALGDVLGRWSGKVDDEKDDSVLWIRPSNNWRREIFSDISEYALQYGLIFAEPTYVIIAGIRCLVRLFRGKECEFSGAAPKPPLDQLEGMMPGFGSIEIDKTVGMWHMMHVGREGLGEYNNIPGTHLENAGPGSPGELDFIVMALGDVTGASLRAGKSNGVKHYGPHDDVEREHNYEWQMDSIGHLEWSSLSSLGEYGWHEFKENPTGSKFLGWPLHALGDVIIPHHIFATMSYGHLSFESAMSDAFFELFWGEENTDDEVSADRNDADNYESENAIIANGYKWWKQFCWDSSLEASKELSSAKSLIEAVAMDNMQYVGTWAWNDDYSVMENLQDSKEKKDEKTASYLADSDFWNGMKPIVSNSSGAALAFLMCAADMVDYQENSSSEEVTRCDDGYGYCASWECGFSFECIEGYTGPESVSVESDIETTNDFGSSTGSPCGTTDWYTCEQFGGVCPSSTTCTEGCCVPDGYYIPGDNCVVQSCMSSAGCDEGYSCSDGCCVASTSVECESYNDCGGNYICCGGHCSVGPVCVE